MTDKIRKRLGPVSVVATIAVLGILAAFIALAALPDITSAQGPPPPPPPPGATPAPAPGGGPPPPPAPPVQATQLETPGNPAALNEVKRELTVSWDAVTDASRYQISWNPASANGQSEAVVESPATSYTITNLEPATEYSISVVALHASNSNLNSVAATVTATTAPVFYTLNLSQDAVEVANEEVTIQASVGTDSSQDTAVNVRIGKADGTMYWLDPDQVYDPRWGISYESGGLKAPAGTQTRDDGSLDVRSRDAAVRVFEIFVECEAPSGEDIRGVLDIEVRDKDQLIVAEASIMCMPGTPPPPPPDEVTASECYSVTGYMGDNENEAMDQMRDDIEPHNRPAHPTNPEMGQDTIEIFESSADVQITVTSCEAGPVYIRFLDSDGDVFGTDIDECETCEGASGADVVGLDSQQKLEMNLGPTEMDAYMALKYDQYNVVTPGDGSDKYLVGKPGMYYQGTFRFIAPCDWDPFEVEIYEKDGKVLQVLQNGMLSETVTCVPSLQPDANELQVSFDTADVTDDNTGTAVVTWETIDDAAVYTVAVIDTTIDGMYTIHGIPAMVTVTAGDPDANRIARFSGIVSETRYIFAVYAEVTSGGYSTLRSVILTPEFVTN